MANFLLFECLDVKSRGILVSCAPKGWRPPHQDAFGGIRQHLAIGMTADEEEELRLERDVRPVMTATPEQVKHWRNT